MIDLFLLLQENVPVVSVLCNPGIRARHWDLMSKVFGHDLSPNSGTTLRKVLKQNLEPYLSEFETISVVASKVITLPKNVWFILQVSMKS